MSYARLFRRLIIIGVCARASSLLGQQANAPKHSWDVFTNTPEAQEEANKLLGHCGDAQTQDVMNACFSIEFKNSEQQLNSTYQATLKQLDQDAREPVRVAQRAWLRYRDLHCKAVGFLQVGEGSLEPTVVFDCKSKLNRARAEEIQATYRTPGMPSSGR
jgi:uncharacterized protein YecT (DUF1311 family)